MIKSFSIKKGDQTHIDYLAINRGTQRQTIEAIIDRFPDFYSQSFTKLVDAFTAYIKANMIGSDIDTNTNSYDLEVRSVSPRNRRRQSPAVPGLLVNLSR